MSIKCSFCGIDQSECRWIFSSSTLNGKHYICDKCIGKISSQIEELKLECPEEKAFLTPSVIKSKLDSYVIGQDRAKRILSVAVYNHYKRLRKCGSRDTEIQHPAHRQYRLRKDLSGPDTCQDPGCPVCDL